MLAIWGVESAYGDPMVQQKYMRPVFPALAALAWGEPRRRAYWEKELLNALVIVERGWSTPKEMIGSWAGAMGHTQWMPEVWLNVGLDFDGDGRVSPFGSPADALASTARYLVNRGKYRRGEHWGYEVDVARRAGARPGVTPPGRPPASSAPTARRSRCRAQPRGAGCRCRADQSFLIGQNFNAVHSYNPSMNYTLAIVHLSDRLRGDGPFVQPFPGSERTPTLAELKELQQRLTHAGFDTGGLDGRVGSDTMRAVRAYQDKVGLEPADGYAGLKVLARLRQGPDGPRRARRRRSRTLLRLGRMLDLRSAALFLHAPVHLQTMTGGSADACSQCATEASSHQSGQPPHRLPVRVRQS